MFSILIIITLACEKYEPESTKAEQFAGDWFYQLWLSDGTPYIDYYDYTMDPLLTFNTSSDTPDEIWIDNQGYYKLPLKIKITIDGSPAIFKSSIGLNEYLVKIPDVKITDLDTIISDTIYDRILAEVIEGKILKNAAKVWDDPQKAETDSIFLKIASYSGILHWLPIITKSGDTVLTRNKNFYTIIEPLDTFIISGHRQTGWEVYLVE